MLLSWEQGSFQGGEQDCNHGWALNGGLSPESGVLGSAGCEWISESLPVGTALSPWKRLSPHLWLPGCPLL